MTIRNTLWLSHSSNFKIANEWANKRGVRTCTTHTHRKCKQCRLWQTSKYSNKQHWSSSVIVIKWNVMKQKTHQLESRSFHTNTQSLTRSKHETHRVIKTGGIFEFLIYVFVRLILISITNIWLSFRLFGICLCAYGIWRTQKPVSIAMCNISG